MELDTLLKQYFDSQRDFMKSEFAHLKSENAKIETRVQNLETDVEALKTAEASRAGEKKVQKNIREWIIGIVSGIGATLVTMFFGQHH